jgi:hypothetical protein
MAEVVYIFINESMPDLVKIGYTCKDIEQRIKELDNTSIPLPFQCFYAAEVQNAKFVETKLHRIFADKRIRNNREFFRIDPNQVKEAIQLAEIKEVTPKQETINDEDITALEKYNTTEERKSNLTFKELNIDIGSVLCLTRDANIICTVVKQIPSKVLFNGEELSLSRAALKAMSTLGYSWTSVRGGDFWKYNDETLTAIRLRIEDK